MLLQYAAAALVSEGKVLAHPAQCGFHTTSGNQEDHVSMGSIAAYKGPAVVRNIAWVIAAELLAAARAMRFISHAPAWAAAPLSRLLSGNPPAG
jgi:histidine ammonia-lyase